MWTEIIGLAATAVAIAGVLLNNRKMRACYILWLFSNAATLGIHPDLPWREKWTGPQKSMIVEHHRVVDSLLKLPWQGPDKFCSAYADRIRERGLSGVWDDED
jgi:hypothetical protein